MSVFLLLLLLLRAALLSGKTSRAPEKNRCCAKINRTKSPPPDLHMCVKTGRRLRHHHLFPSPRYMGHLASTFHLLLSSLSRLRKISLLTRETSHNCNTIVVVFVVSWVTLDHVCCVERERERLTVLDRRRNSESDFRAHQYGSSPSCHVLSKCRVCAPHVPYGTCMNFDLWQMLSSSWENLQQKLGPLLLLRQVDFSWVIFYHPRHSPQVLTRHCGALQTNDRSDGAKGIRGMLRERREGGKNTTRPKDQMHRKSIEHVLYRILLRTVIREKGILWGRETTTSSVVKMCSGEGEEFFCSFLTVWRIRMCVFHCL